MFFAQADHADLLDFEEGDAGLDVEAEKHVAVFNGMELVTDQASWFFLVSSAVVPVVWMHDGLVLLARASSTEDVLV